MQIVVLAVSTGLVFLALDALMLGRVIAPFFSARLGDAMLDGFRVAPAVLFYLGYVAGVVWFVGLPALRAGSPAQALVQGALLGALAYGTYELTNHATLARWTWGMVALDLTWGAALTGLAAWAGVIATRAIVG